MPDAASRQSGLLTVFLVFLRLGLTSFGGPVAHLGYFHQEFVVRRRWLGERAYADLVALCQFLPGPASSQVGMAIGLSRAGYAGALAAWVGFTLPSAVVLILFAQGIAQDAGLVPAGVLHGLKVVAVAVVAQAVWGMARNLCPDTPRLGIMAVAAGLALLAPAAWLQLLVIALAGGIGLACLKPGQAAAGEHLAVPLGPRAGWRWLGLFALLLLGLPLLAALSLDPTLLRMDAFFRSGALVFGGGHVVLPLLQAEVVARGWVGNEAFLAGYGAAQAVPGPLFSFAAFLGASMQAGPSGWAGGLLYLAAIFAPAFMLLCGALPLWERLRRLPRARAAMMGINAGVVGLLLAALYQPVWTSAILQPRDFALALVALAALQFCKVPAWLVVLATAAAGGALQGG
ncbi:chromate transporter [Pseudomonas delhiensis]|uniref:Chromate transporter n=1 Tax=Pseudomonas delhiensis TaxID=366289 RepID=A0A239M1A4_9PSED|nr:chromate efflux transporter [Pseudomonas delhiensis]SDJ38406.1 chromate transporter [Pseudomonas delhiensis]SNT36415.1 chromate transporter [Pseudomonas delhiensis]